MSERLRLLDDIVIDLGIGLAKNTPAFDTITTTDTKKSSVGSLSKKSAGSEGFSFQEFMFLEEMKKKALKEEKGETTKETITHEEPDVREVLTEAFAKKEDARYFFSGEDQQYMKFSHSATPWEKYFVNKKQYETLKGVMQYVSGLNDLGYLSAFERALVKYDSYVNRPEFRDPYVRDYFVHIPAGAHIEKVPQSVLGEGVLGTCEPHIGRIRVLDTLYNASFMEVLMHEVFHLQHPGASERAIRNMTSERMEQLGVATMFHH